MSAILKHYAQQTVSVIIPCYNHAKYLSEAIESVLNQSYPNIEIIVVDDGSTDDTYDVAAAYPSVRYFHQDNAGLSAARNKGIYECTGNYLVFLDADDWLYKDALLTNYNYLQENRSCAFVSGWHDKVDEWGYPLLNTDDLELVEDDHYIHFLRGNYIGMHATVMYQRWVFRDFRFDSQLKACEDYDIYFKVARKYQVGCHKEKLAAYRIHGSNMSANVVSMLKNVLLVCNRQKELLQNDAERKAYREGLKIWNEYYAAKLYGNHTVDIESKKSWPSLEEIKVMAMEKPMESLSYLVKKSIVSGTQWYKTTLPDIAKKLLHQQGYRQDYTPGVGQIKPGDFNRVKPFSEDFGFDRGGALDRFYIESFLNENSGSIKGAVLELGDNEYTLKFGKDAVETSDILHVDGTNERATFIGDITNIPEIQSEYFDCVICTQKLMLVYDVRSALESCYRILKPGGCLLLTVPGITNIDRGAWKNYWLWSFTDISVRKLMEDTFGNSEIAVKAYGNVHVATSFLYGVGMQEFNKEAFEYQDPSYQVVISAKAIKK